MFHRSVEKFWYTIYIMPVASLAALFYIWDTTNPGTVGPLGILSVFVLLYIFWASVFFAALHIGFAVFKKTNFFRIFMTRRENRPFNWRLSYYIASIVAFMPVLLLAMQSVNQLSLRDVLFVVMFTGLAIFYVVKRN